ncbi:hypothetical protein C3F34_14200 [Acinetobacter sp. ACNIH2]|uniref:hypothetical protein n=1 Tax=Acinetobacter sp. ACNIH2 TaxID=1758189 RepID=UPI000CDCCC73|nr:hypothetical protein [Acinetobacter sp. ACNIH2]AUX87074.1 hypothetical protein C3F34_14200 [Acinetobacter sp. ACNIH2]
MYKLSQVDQIFIQELHDAFDDVHLEDRFTLLEEDFADTSYLRRYPHQQPYDLNAVDYFSKSNLLNEIKNSDLLVGEKNDLILAINEEQRVINHYRTWGVVPFEYLNKYAHGFYFITPEAYVFYTPVLILNLVLNPEFFKGVAFDKWLSRLLMEVNEHNSLTLFNNNQSRLIKKFLSNILLNKSIIDFIEAGDVKRALEKINKN